MAAFIAYAYDVQDHQLSGGPDWVRTERYEVAARAGREVSQTELRAMVKTLLEDRFTLRVRTETREMPFFELRLARSDGRVGPNLHDCSNPHDKEGISIATRQLQTTVVDKTGLTGQWRFNVYYGWEPPTTLGIQEKANPDLPSFVTALQEQLGLRLERTRGPVPVVVIESVERPTPD